VTYCSDDEVDGGRGDGVSKDKEKTWFPDEN
jgi:hypothetical protein